MNFSKKPTPAIQKIRNYAVEILKNEDNKKLCKNKKINKKILKIF